MKLRPEIALTKSLKWDPSNTLNRRFMHTVFSMCRSCKHDISNSLTNFAGRSGMVEYHGQGYYGVVCTVELVLCCRLFRAVCYAFLRTLFITGYVACSDSTLQVQNSRRLRLTLPVIERIRIRGQVHPSAISLIILGQHKHSSRYYT